jgi:hypothetical protein
MPEPLRTAVAIARADFRERTRRYAFLLALGFCCWLGWLTSEGTLRVELGPWRGRLDSAWIGGSLAIVAATFLTLVGYWLVRGTIERDRATGVGEILAATPMTRPAYLVGKWLSHAAYLGALALLLALAAIVMAARHSVAGIDLPRLWLPMLLVALPALVFVCGLAVVFEVLPGLRGGLGNVAWVFAWALLLVLSMRGPALDWSGLVLTRASMRADLLAAKGVDETGFRVGGGPRHATQVFPWHGLEWTPGALLGRAQWLGAGLLLALAGVPFFDRFDASRRRLRRLATPRGEPVPDASGATPSEASAAALPEARRGGAFAALVQGELRRALAGRRPLFWIGAAALVIGSLFATPAQAPPLALASLWPILLWSRLGAPDAEVAAVLLSCPRPVQRPVAAAFVAGVLVAAPFVLATCVRATFAGHVTGLAAALCAALFPAALGLALGSWASSPKPFEAAYTALWYLALQTPALDFMGATPAPDPWPFLAAVPALLAVAAAGRARALR